jgi:hypothetical protein
MDGTPESPQLVSLLMLPTLPVQISAPQEGTMKKKLLRFPSFNRLLLSFLTLQLLDLVTTLIVFAHGGVELNPIVRSILPHLGPTSSVVASKTLVSAIALPLSNRRRVLIAGDILYSLVVLWNLFVLCMLYLHR